MRCFLPGSPTVNHCLPSLVIPPASSPYLSFPPPSLPPCPSLQPSPPRLLPPTLLPPHSLSLLSLHLPFCQIGRCISACRPPSPALPEEKPLFTSKKMPGSLDDPTFLSEPKTLAQATEGEVNLGAGEAARERSMEVSGALTLRPGSNGEQGRPRGSGLVELLVWVG